MQIKVIQTAYLIGGLLIFFLMGMDKLQAIRSKRRVSEKILLSCGLITGGVGLMLGMMIFRHKIRKPIFWIVSIVAVGIHLYLFPLLGDS